MLVRPATPADALAIAAIHIASWQAAYRGILPDAYLDTLSVDQRRQMWETGLNRPPSNFWHVCVCELDGRTVGFGSFGRTRDADLDPKTTGELYTLYALSDVWAQGVGRALWLHMLELLRSSPFQSIMLWVLADNARGRRFYERAGFALDGASKKDEIGGQSVTELRYRRPLP